MKADLNFSSDVFSFKLSSADIQFDAETGMINVPALSLVDKATFSVMAEGSGGAQRIDFVVDAQPVSAPVLQTPPSPLTLAQDATPERVYAGAWFSGNNLTFEVEGAAEIDPDTGMMDLSRAVLGPDQSVLVRARNSAGQVEARLSYSVILPVLAPRQIADMPSITFTQHSGVQTISAQAIFAGTDLIYTLRDAPDGVSVDANSGLIRVPTETALEPVRMKVRAKNAAGLVVEGFWLSVEAAEPPQGGGDPVETVLDTDAAVAELSFPVGNAAPAITREAGRIMMAPTALGRAHGAWSRVRGDGLLQALFRPSSSKSQDPDLSPVLLGARVSQDGDNFYGVFAELFDPEWGAKQIQLCEYTGIGKETRILAKAVGPWAWDQWVWVDLDVDGAEVKARVYKDGETAPDWQVSGQTTALTPGFSGPGLVAIEINEPRLRLSRMGFTPKGMVLPPLPDGAADTNWDIAQYTERS